MVCGDELSSEGRYPELPVLAYCYGQVLLAYPFLPLPIIPLRDDDLFLVQQCARKFPDHKGTHYRFPTIPSDQNTLFNNTLFEIAQLESSESKSPVFAYYVKRQKSCVADCLVNKLFHGENFQVSNFFIIGVISCKIRDKDKKIRIVREVVRAFCNGVSTFQPREPDSHLLGVIKVSPKSPFNVIECISPPEDLLEKRLMNPDQAIKDSLAKMSDK